MAINSFMTQAFDLIAWNRSSAVSMSYHGKECYTWDSYRWKRQMNQLKR